MDTLTFILMAVSGVAFAVYWYKHYKAEEDVAKKAIQVSKMLSTKLVVIPKAGEGFTKDPNEIQLVNQQLSILYTKTKRPDGKTVETAHIRLKQGSFLTITVLNHLVLTIGGNYTNIHYPDLPFQAKYAIAKIFEAIYKADHQNTAG